MHTRPALRVTVGGCGLSVCAILNDIVAFAEVLDLGTYTMFLASETTFSLTVAESKNDSFTTKFELTAVI